jgi:hypothetical protein
LSRLRGKSRAGDRATQKDVKNDDRSGKVYENKGPNDKMPDTKGDISTQLHAILHRNRRILQKPSALLSLFDRWGTNPSLQNAETRTRCRCGDRGGTARRGVSPKCGVRSPWYQDHKSQVGNLRSKTENPKVKIENRWRQIGRQRTRSKIQDSKSPHHPIDG